MALTKVTGKGLETLSDGVTITVDDNSDTLTLTSTDADGNSGPNLRLYRNSSSPANDDFLGTIEFEGRNDNSEDFVAARIFTFTPDVSDGSEDAQLQLSMMKGGSSHIALEIKPDEFIINNGSVDMDFRVEGNGDANLLKLDAGNDRVGIGVAAPLAKFHVNQGSGSLLFTNTFTNVGHTACHFSNSEGSGAYRIRFDSNDTVVGSIGVGTSSTAYNTSSDYRLKENVDYTWDATTRLKQLKPARFNFIADDTNTLVDGFIAHEVSSIVPEAITGTKDAVDADDNPEYQGIDQSKLVPLLVKTIQELEARITALEA